MEVFEIRRFDLLARSEQHLRERLTTFRHAVHARAGAIIDVRFLPGTAKERCAASVAYELPIAETGARLATQREEEEEP